MHLYFLHRYQTEATVKLIGGMDYNYAVKGDGQLITRVIDKKLQEEALKSVLKTLSPKILAVPKDKLVLFPPRAMGHWRSRESFKGKTGVAFDAIGVTSTASDMTLGLLLNPERASRLVQQKAMDSKQLGLEKMITQLVDRTIKAKPAKGYELEIQRAVNFNVLKYLMNLSASSDSYEQVDALVNFELMKIRKWLGKKATEASAVAMSRSIDRFLKTPRAFKLIASPKIPDGSPIGCYGYEMMGN